MEKPESLPTATKARPRHNELRRLGSKLLATWSLVALMSGKASANPGIPDSDKKNIDVHGEQIENRELQVRIFLEKIAEFKSRGYKVKVVKGVTTMGNLYKVMDEKEPVFGLQTIFNFDNNTPEIEQSYSDNPLENVIWRYAARSELAPELDLEPKEIEVYPLSLEVDSEHKLTLRYWLGQQTKELLKIPVSQKQSIIYVNKNSALDLTRLLTETFANMDKLEADLNAALPNPETIQMTHEAYSVAPKEYHIKSKIDQARKLLSSIPELSLVSIPSGGEYDRSIATGQINRMISFELKAEHANNGKIPIFINGQLKEFSVNLGNIKIASIDPSRKLINGFPYVEHTKDKYGNILVAVFPGYLNRVSVGDYITRMLIVFPPLNFGSSNESRTDIKVDLSRFSLPSIEGLLFALDIPLIKNFGSNMQYHLYSNMPRDDVESHFKKAESEVIRGIGEIERAFGFGDGKMIKNIYVVNSSEPNAFVSKKDPETIVLHDEIIASNINMDSIARHEASHVIDESFGLSAGEVRLFYERIKDNKPFFDELNENAFLEIGGYGGHAYDNEKEFLASMVNSIFAPNLEKTLGEKNDGFLDIYHEALFVLRKAILESSGLPTNCHITEKIDNAVACLDSIRAVGSGNSNK